MKSHVLLAGVAVSIAACAGCGVAADFQGLFKHHPIARDIAQKGTSTSGYGCPVLADFDRDGDLDFAVTVGQEKAYWFENEGSDGWKPHEVGPLTGVQLGANSTDVDGDGWVDIVIGGAWYRNTRQPRTQPFERYVYDPNIKTEIHDLVIADVDGDGRRDVVALGDREGCFWYAIPADLTRKEPWPRKLITDAVLNEKDDIHGGPYPRGVDDLDGDGDADLVLPDRWLENRDRGTAWVRHPLPWGKKGPWGLSSRSWIVDIDGDGDRDIVVVDCDQKDSRGAVLVSNGAKPPAFEATLLPKSAPGVRGSFHSLAVADFDADGDLDIATAEQEDPSILPAGATPRWYIWENVEAKAMRFEERVILDAKLGGHDILAGDIDGDGDIDIAGKIWRRWPGNANEGRFHADWMENRLKP